MPSVPHGDDRPPHRRNPPQSRSDSDEDKEHNKRIREGNEINDTSVNDEIIFLDSIRLPFLEEYFPRQRSQTSSKCRNSTFFDLPVQQQQVHPAFTFLSTCHTLNLVMSHHLCAIAF